MAQHTLLAALCVLIATHLISSAEAASCRSRCTSRCLVVKKQQKSACLMGCQVQPKNCQRCTIAHKCTKCLPGFKLSSTRRCVVCPAGCNCNSNGKCLTCITGYVMTYNGCAACPTGCKCDSSATCLSCLPGYVASTSAYPPCLACPANCFDCSKSGPMECTTCNEGFRLTNGLCQACLSGCLYCNSGVGTCDTCKTGYKLTTSGVTNICAECPANCASCDIAGTSHCDVCIDGYGLNSDHTRCDIACAPNCKSCNWNGYNLCDSQQCKSGYRYVAASQDCSQSCTVANCDTCQTSASGCDKCKTGFILTNDATCLGTGCASTVTNCIACSPTDSSKCVQCADLYGLNPTTGTCTSCGADVNCLSCTVTATGVAQGCTKCVDGYLPGISAPASGSPTCWPCRYGCKDCTSTNMNAANGKCTVCDTASGFNILNKGACSGSCDPNCATQSCPNQGAGKCDKKCRDGYALNANFQCDPCDPHCAAPYCDVQQSGKCDVKCIDGWVLQPDHTCAQCHSNCKHCMFAGAQKCDGPQCAAGYKQTADLKCQA